jgi:hypothetical protein
MCRQLALDDEAAGAELPMEDAGAFFASVNVFETRATML